jgi:hypothetical protein
MAFLWALQTSSAMIVTVVEKPSQQTTLGDVIIGSLGLTGVLVLIAAVLGVLFAGGRMMWNHRHRPDDDHLPSVIRN